MAHSEERKIRRSAACERCIPRLHRSAGRLGHPRLLFTGVVLRRPRGIADHDRGVDRDFDSPARSLAIVDDDAVQDLPRLRVDGHERQAVSVVRLHGAIGEDCLAVQIERCVNTLIVDGSKADAVDVGNAGDAMRPAVIRRHEISEERSAVRTQAVDRAVHTLSPRFTCHRLALSRIGTAAVMRPSAIEGPRSWAAADGPRLFARWRQRRPADW